MRRIENIDFANHIYQGTKREPVWRVLLFDRSDPLYKIVLGNYTQIPLDITTNIVGQLTINESNSAAASLTATLTTDNGLTPNHFLGRPIIKIEESDRRILSELGEVWISMFCGPVLGQPGYTAFGRDQGKQITISAMDRSYYYNKKQLASSNFDNGEDFGDIGVEIPTDTEWGMCLEREEVDFGEKDYTVNHTYISIREVPYMEGLSLLFFILNLRPVFGGDGKLKLLDMSLDKAPVRIYQNMDVFKHIRWLQENVDIINQVRIIGLASTITKQSYPRQIVANTKGTLGYFTEKWKEKIYYSEDRSQRAEDPRVEEFEINGWLGSIAKGDVEVVEIDEFSFMVVIKCPYNAWVFIVFFIGYVAFFVVGLLLPYISPATNLLAAIWLCVGLAMMQQIGQFTLSVSAEAYQNVYKEVEGVKTWSHLEDYEIREKMIENHLVDTEALAESLAERELKKETIKGHPRSISMLPDPFLEPDDIIEILDGSRYMLQSISRRYSRESVNLMDIRALLIKSESSGA